MDVYGLIGNPVGHSVSPPMHEAAYSELGLDARYVTFEPPEVALGAALEGASALGVRGLNVTIPYKEAVLPHVDPDPLAERIGAVNTIDFPDGRAEVGESGGTGEGTGGAGTGVTDHDGGDGTGTRRGPDGSAGGDGTDLSRGAPTGHNTDAAGVTRAFEHHGVELSGTAVVVGAGGAGRAAVFALADEGVTVRIANRTVSRAESLAEEVPGASAHGLDELGSIIGDADLLVNATSVGMGTDETPVPADALHGDLAVLDAVYDPIETRLLHEAASVGATTVDGAWMLLYQGVEAFELWTGRDAPVAAMNEALRAAL